MRDIYTADDFMNELSAHWGNFSNDFKGRLVQLLATSENEVVIGSNFKVDSLGNININSANITIRSMETA